MFFIHINGTIYGSKGVFNMKKNDLKKGKFVVSPVHGVGVIEDLEEKVIADIEIQLVNIFFQKDKMKISIPLHKAIAGGVRELSSKVEVEDVFQFLKQSKKIRKIVWNKISQQYEAKLNSGVLIQVAEILKDLHYVTLSTEHSYSEREMYISALSKLALECAVVLEIDENEVVDYITELLDESSFYVKKAAS